MRAAKQRSFGPKPTQSPSAATDGLRANCFQERCTVDDFPVEASLEGLGKVEATLRNHFETMRLAVVGPDTHDTGLTRCFTLRPNRPFTCVTWTVRWNTGSSTTCCACSHLEHDWRGMMTGETSRHQSTLGGVEQRRHDERIGGSR